MAGSNTVERTIAKSHGTFAWQEEIPLFLNDEGAVTFEDTGEPLMRKKTGAQAVGLVNRTAERGESVLLPESVAAEWDDRGAFDPTSKPTIAVAAPAKRGPGRPRNQ